MVGGPDLSRDPAAVPLKVDAGPAHVTEADREEARRRRQDHFFSDPDPDLAERIYMPIRFLWRALEAFGYRRDLDRGLLAPDGAPAGDMVEAIQIEIVAAALASERESRSPESQAFDQIREVAKIPAGQTLLTPEERIRALTAKIERIGNIAGDRAPDEDWRPALIEEAGRLVNAPPDLRRRIEGPVPPARTKFCENVERLRRERGYSAEALAARSKIDPGELAELLRGERRVFIDVIYLLAGALGVEAEDLFDGIEWKPPASGGSGWTITGGGQDG